MAPLPESGEGYGLVVRTWVDGDAESLHDLVKANLEHLRPRMAWIAADPPDVAARRALIREWERLRADGEEVVLGIFEAGSPVGSTGFRIMGDGRAEVGYWVDRFHLRRGIATRAAALSADLAFTVSDVDTVVIPHDVENLASRGVPEGLGFTHVGVEAPSRALAPADTGRDDVWQLAREDWSARGGRTMVQRV